MLSVLLVFSFLNVTMFTDYANAEGDNGEATEFAEPVGEPEAQAQPEDEANGPESEEPAEEVNAVLPPMYFPPFTPMIHNRSRQPAPAGYANVFPPLSAPPSNLSRNARASRARALSEPG